MREYSGAPDQIWIWEVDTMCMVCIIEPKGDDTMNTIRKNITLPVTAYETINDYAKK